MIDIGVNLASSKFLQRDELIEKAKSHALTGLISISNTPQEWTKNIEFSKIYSQPPDFVVKTTIGIHPHHAKSALSYTFSDIDHQEGTQDINKSIFEELEALASQNHVVAIGECGLDFDRMFSTKEQQIAVFKRQIDIAAKVNKPLYLHVRNGPVSYSNNQNDETLESATDVFVSIMEEALKKYPNLRGVVHCFTGTFKDLSTFLSLGLYFGITGWVCDERRNDSLLRALKTIDQNLLLQRIMFETDAPYLLPPCFAKTEKINYPHAIWEVVEYVADLLYLDFNCLVQASIQNTKTLFSF